MLLFRSEEHLATWLSERDIGRGQTMTLAQQWELSSRWYSNRLDSDWRRRTPDEAQEIFESCGLTGDFWRLS